MAEVPNFRVQDPADVEEIKVGDRVRSYDFAYHDDCYVEGTVHAIGLEIEGCPRYEIVGERRRFGEKGDLELAGDLFYPPVNGTPTLTGGYTNGVRRLT